MQSGITTFLEVVGKIIMLRVEIGFKFKVQYQARCSTKFSYITFIYSQSFWPTLLELLYISGTLAILFTQTALAAGVLTSNIGVKVRMFFSH